LKTYIIPIRVVLNPPDIIKKDLYLSSGTLMEYQAIVAHVNFETQAVRFLGIQKEEDGPDTIRKEDEYLLWNRSKYTAQLFYRSKNKADVRYLLQRLEEEKLMLIIRNISFSIEYFKNHTLIKGEPKTKTVIKSADGGAVTKEPPLKMDYGIKIFEATMEVSFVSDFKLKYGISPNAKSRNIICPIHSVSIPETTFVNEFDVSIVDPFVNIEGYIGFSILIHDFMIGDVLTSVWKFAKITGIENVLTIDSTLYDVAINVGTIKITRN